MTWDILTSDCPYEPNGEFSDALCRVVTQEDVDIFEAMARAHQRAVQEIERLNTIIGTEP